MDAQKEVVENGTDVRARRPLHDSKMTGEQVV